MDDLLHRKGKALIAELSSLDEASLVFPGKLCHFDGKIGFVRQQRGLDVELSFFVDESLILKKGFFASQRNAFGEKQGFQLGEMIVLTIAGYGRDDILRPGIEISPQQLIGKLLVFVG